MGYFEKEYADDFYRWLEVLRSQNADLVYVEPSGGHSWGHWRGVIAPMMRHFFPGKSALTDSSNELSSQKVTQ
jgi:hypothetical protein